MAGLRSKSEIKECYNSACPMEAACNQCNNQCRIENVLYKAWCTRCRAHQEEAGIKPELVYDYLYIGETSRTLGIRSNQHKDDYLRCTRKTPEEEGSSFIWDHQVAAHNGAQVDPLKDYSFSIIEGTSDPFTRQIKESVQIQESLDIKT